MIAEELKAGGKVQMVGFGTFEVSERAAREGRNPRTGATMKIERQSITVSDVMESGQVVENPMIGAIPSRNEVQRELDDLLMSM